MCTENGSDCIAHKRSKRSGYSGTRPDFSVICKSSKIAPQNGQHKLDDKCPNLPSVQRGTKVATGQFLYSFICHQKKWIKMLQQYVRSNIRTSGKELFRLSLFYHDPFVDFQCLLKTESLPSMSHLHYPHFLVYWRMWIIGLTTRIETSSTLE